MWENTKLISNRCETGQNRSPMFRFCICFSSSYK